MNLGDRAAVAFVNNLLVFTYPKFVVSPVAPDGSLNVVGCCRILLNVNGDTLQMAPISDRKSVV